MNKTAPKSSKSNYFFNKLSNSTPDFVEKYRPIFGPDEIIEFHNTLEGYSPTPLILLQNLAHKLNIGNLFVKDESHRMGINAFKILGASYAMHKILKEREGDVTFCTATDGNHGRAVARAAKLSGKKAVVFVPDVTVKERAENIRKEGAEVIVVRGDYDATVEAAKKYADKNNALLIQDSSWGGYTEIPALIMAGYTTILRELETTLHMKDKPGFDIVILKSGVGSWAASAIWYYYNRYGANCPKIVPVEPAEADCCIESMRQGKLSVTKGSQKTIMAGLNCGTPSVIAMDILREGADLFITIPDYYAEKAMQTLYYPETGDEQIVSGESGAAGLAGLIALLKEDELRTAREAIGLSDESRVLIFNTEGDTDRENFKKIINK